MPRNNRITIRLNDDEYNKIIERTENSMLTLSEYSRKCLLNKKLINLKGIDELTIQLRKIGNNLNQLTRLANENRMTVVDLSIIKKGLSEVWQLLNLLIQKAD